jgi:hypothetical protein
MPVFWDSAGFWFQITFEEDTNRSKTKPTGFLFRSVLPGSTDRSKNGLPPRCRLGATSFGNLDRREPPRGGG